jgi:hypothetical protein
MSLRAALAMVAVCLALPAAALAERGSAVPGPPNRVMAEAAERAFALARARFETGQDSLEVVYQWSVRWLEAQRRLQPASAAAAAGDHQRRVRELCTLAVRQVDAGTLDASARSACDYYLAEAELWVQTR